MPAASLARLADRLASGAIIDDRWRVEDLLGEGGMGAVYAATHIRNGHRVALKVLHPEVARDETLRRRFLQEGYAANRVGHPGAVQVLDDGVTREGVVYLVMERLEGRPLDALADEHGGKLPVDVTVGHALGWLEVMAAAHAVGIVHRDLKPENAMVCRDGRVKVLDFGLARVREVSSQLRLTVSQTPMGTPAFMPPEQALGQWEQVDARSDVYALGASLFTLLTGRLVHEARTVNEMIVKVCTQPARPVRSVEPAVPAGLARVIDRALAFEPARRHADARAMLSDLRRAAAEVGRVAPVKTLASPVGPVDFCDAPTETQPDRVLVAGPRPIQPGGFDDPDTTTRIGSGGARHTTAPVSSDGFRGAKHRRMGAAVAAAGILATIGGYLALANAPSAPPASPGIAPVSASAEAPRPAAPSAALVAERPTASAAPRASTAPRASAPASASAPATTRPRGGRPAPAAPCKKDPFTLRCK